MGPSSKKKASFFVDFEKRDQHDDIAVINESILDANLNIVPFSDTIPTPNRRMEFIRGSTMKSMPATPWWRAMNTHITQM